MVVEMEEQEEEEEGKLHVDCKRSRSGLDEMDELRCERRCGGKIVRGRE